MPALRISISALVALFSFWGGISAQAGDEVPPAPTGFKVTSATVMPDMALYGGRTAILRFRFRAQRNADVRVVVERLPSHKVVRSWVLAGLKQGRLHRLEWRGLLSSGKPAADGRYEFRLGKRGRARQSAGRFDLRGHVFPVDGPHGVRGAVGRYHAPRSGGRIHDGFDITAAIGTKLVATRAGKVIKRGYDPVLYGWYVQIDARHSKEDFFYAHMRDAPSVGKGDGVKTGQKVGVVGITGNAATTPPHLHIEIRTPKGTRDPEPDLNLWDTWS